MSQNPADPQPDTQPDTQPDLQAVPVPEPSPEPSPEHTADGSFHDGNLDPRGVMPVAGRPQVDPEGAQSLDDDLDTSLRTDGTGRPDGEA